MEKFDSQEYRDQLAKDLKSIPNHGDRKNALEKEKTSFRYDDAKQIHTEETQDLIKSRLENIKKLEELGCKIYELNTDPSLADEYSTEEMLRKAGIETNDRAKNMLSYMQSKQNSNVIEFPNKSTKYTLVEIVPLQFGFVKEKFGKIIEKVHEFGLELCPSIIGPQLALKNDLIKLVDEKPQTTDSLTIAMHQIPANRFGSNGLWMGSFRILLEKDGSVSLVDDDSNSEIDFIPRDKKILFKLK